MTERLVCAPAPPLTALIAGAHLVDPRSGHDGPADVIVQDGTITSVCPAGSGVAPAGAERIEGHGRHLFPSFVDGHVHLRVPGQEHKEDIQTGTRAAAAGGFGAIVAMPNTDPPIDTPELVRSLRDLAAREACVPTGQMACVTRGLRGDGLTDMVALREAGAVGFTDDGLPVASAGLLRRAMRYQLVAGGVIALHEEDHSLSAGGSMHEGAVAARLGVAGIPSLSESTMVARDCALALHEGARVHMQHVSCVESVQALAAARAAGARVTAEVTPHHLLLCEDDVAGLDTSMKINPPLRGAADRAALLDALRDGVIDCIATDHAPHHSDDKEVPFEEAAFGTTGLECAFAVLYDGLVREGSLPLERLVHALTAAAEILELPVPRLAEGERANLTMVDLEAELRIGESGYESRSRNCAFAGRTVHGRVLLTCAAGAVAYRERAFALSAA